MLVTTHYLDEAERCHRVALIHGGRLAVLGTTTEVKGIFKGRPIVEVRADDPVEAVRILDRAPGVEKTSLFGTTVHAVLRNDGVDLDELRTRLGSGGVVVEAIEPVVPSLEDVFLEVVDRAGGAVA